MKDVVKRLDKIANSLEKKGLIKEAHEIDIIANTIEAFDVSRLPQNQAINRAINFINTDNAKKAIEVLISLEENKRLLVEGYKDKQLKDGTFPVIEYEKNIDKARELLERGDFQSAVNSLTQALDNLQDLSFFMNQPTGQPFKPINTPTQQRTPQNINPQRNAPGDMFFSGPKKRGLFQKMFK